MRKLFIVLILFELFCGVFVQAQTKQQWREDLEFLKSELPKRHVHLFFSLSQKDFNRHIDNLVSNLDAMNKSDILIGLQRLVAKIGDSHTSVSFPVGSASRVPLNTYFYSDGVYITEGIPDLLNKKILSINGFAINTILDSLTLLVVNDNASMLQERLPRFLSNLNVLRYFGFLKGNTIVYRCQDSSKAVKEYKFAVSDFDSMRENSVKASVSGDRYPSFKSVNDFFWQEFQEDDSIYYVRYKECVSRFMNFFIHYFLFEPRDIRPVPSFHKFKKVLLRDLKQLPVKKLVFDMRDNGGGSSFQGTSLIKKIAKNKVINQRGRIFVLIDRGTFSSAFSNTLDFKNFTQAITVGESPSQRTGSFGDIRSFILPNSKLRVSYSTKYFSDESLKGDRFIPDIEVPIDFEDFINGIDRAYLEAVRY